MPRTGIIQMPLMPQPTKTQLINTLQRTQIHTLIVKDSVSKNDIPTIQKELKDFIGTGSKNVSMIVIKET